MASYTYGRLTVPVSADTRALASEVSSSATKAGDEAGRKLSASIGSSLGRAGAKVGKGLATALGTGVIAATAFGVESFKAAAKVDTMNAALQALAKANHSSYPEMQKTIEEMRKQGIEASAAQTLVAGFTKGHLDLADATKLSTVAQNAATVTGKSTSDTLIALNKGIQTQNLRLLKTAGVAVDTKKAMADYGAQIGVNVKNLTSQEKAQAVLNAVLVSGQKVAGAYAAAMKTPGGVLKQLPIIIDEIKVAVGQGLVKALGPTIVGVGHLASSLQEAIEPGGKLAPIFDVIGKSATSILAPLSGVVDLTAKWLDTLDPAKVTAMAGALGKFAPEIAAVGTGLAGFAGKNLLGDLPVVGRFLGTLGGPLGIVITSLTTLALTSPAARDELAKLAAVVRGAVVPIVRMLAPIVGELGQAVGTVLTAALAAVLPLVPPLVVALDGVLHVILPLVPVITVLANVLAAMLPYILPLVAAWYAFTLALAAYEAVTVAVGVAVFAVRNVTLLWAVAQNLLNIALDANPIGLIILACVGLAAVLVVLWTRSAAFRNIVIATWNALSAAAGIVTKAITQNWQTMVRVVLAVVTGGMSELVLLVVRNWTQIRNTTTSAVSAVGRTVSSGWSAVANTTATIWRNITGTVSRAWSNIIGGARLAGANVVNGLKAGMAAAISGIGSWIKNGIVDPIINHVKSFFGIHSPSTVMMGIGQNLVKGLFIGLGGVGNLVGDVFGGMPQALAGLLGKGLVSAAHLPAKAMSAVMGLYSGGKKAVGWLGGLLGKIGGAIGSAFTGSVSGGVARWAPLMAQVLGMFGIPQLQGVFMQQMQTESGGNPRAINLWDSNAKAGIPSQGLMQVIPPTFAAYAGPFRSRGILDPLANIYAAVAYAISRYGRNIAAVLGHGHGYASGGIINEPVTGFGHRTGHAYFIGERGPEMVSPLTGPGMSTRGLGAGGHVINVYPSAGMDERALAAMVSRELAWATAGGVT